MRQTLKIGAMLLVVAALATTGVALAQSGDGSSVFTGANASDWPVERPLRTAIVDWLEPLVDEGTITQEQAEAVADTLAEHLPGLGQRLVRGLGALDEAADFLGMTVQELAEALREGTTLGDLAEEHGLSAQALIDHLVGLVEDRLDEAVADGHLTEEQAADCLARATERITDLVNGVLGHPFPSGGPGEGFGPGPGRHGPGMGDGPCRPGAADDTVADPGT